MRTEKCDVCGKQEIEKQEINGRHIILIPYGSTLWLMHESFDLHAKCEKKLIKEINKVIKKITNKEGVTYKWALIH